MSDSIRTIDLKKYFDGIKKNHPNENQLSFLLAFSGGIDSMVLLHATCLCGIKPILAHCNFQLRGDDSLNDEAFVSKIAKNYDLQIITKKISIDKSKNIQLQAREQRYCWFKQLMNKKNISYCLMGHHSNDYLETFLINMIRGTGISGLQLPEKRGKIIRPLINYTKQAIKNYAQEQNLIWREDSSNSETKYRRNYIRHHIVPHLRELNPKIEHTLVRNMNRLKFTKRFINYGIHHLKKNHITPYEDGIRINISDIEKEMGYSLDAFVIFELTNGYHFSYKQCEQISKSFYKHDYIIENTNRSFRMFIGQSIWYIFPIIKYDSLIINSLNCMVNYFFWSYKLEIIDKKPTFEESKNIVIIPLNSIMMPLKLRIWRKGDKFLPFGMQGKSKKISNYLTDMKFSLALKKRQVILKDKNNIIWVVGQRKSEIIKRDESTTDNKYLVIERTKSNNEL